MNSTRRLSVATGLHLVVSFLIGSFLIVSFLIVGALAGCTGSKEAETNSAKAASVRSFTHNAEMYRVEIEQREVDGRCLQRMVLFTSYSRLYTDPHVDRVRAVDIGCDAIDSTGFEEFEILRSPEQQSRYRNSFSFRDRVNEDLWYAYQEALFDNSRV